MNRYMAENCWFALFCAILVISCQISGHISALYVGVGVSRIFLIGDGDQIDYNLIFWLLSPVRLPCSLANKWFLGLAERVLHFMGCEGTGRQRCSMQTVKWMVANLQGDENSFCKKWAVAKLQGDTSDPHLREEKFAYRYQVPPEMFMGKNHRYEIFCLFFQEGHMD